MAPIASKALFPSTPEQLAAWKSMAAWNEQISNSSDSFSSGRGSPNTHVRASCVPALFIEMHKWNFGKDLAIEKVEKLELCCKDKYIAGNHDAYERLWDDFHDMHDTKKIGDDNRRREGVRLADVTLLYREVRTALKAGISEYNLRYPNPGLHRFDSDRRALRFILVKRWRVLLQRVKQLSPEDYDHDKVEIK